MTTDQQRRGEFMSRQTLRAWATFWCKFILWWAKPTVVVITGSAGKSTTTAVVAAFLAHPRVAEVVGASRASSGNLNNHFGVPLAILGETARPVSNAERLLFFLRAPTVALRAVLGRFPHLLVLELGTDRPGYLDPMVRLVAPAIGVVTTVAPAHLERLRSIEGVLEEKSTVLKHLPPSGLGIVGENHGLVDQLAARSTAPVVRLPGKGQDLAKRIARTIGEWLKVPDDAIETALLDSPVLEGRLRPVEAHGIRILDDCYNANPASVQFGLETLAAMAGNRRKLAILGTMAELGCHSEQYHREVGGLARRHADVIVGVGTFTKSFNPDVWFADSAACAEGITRIVRPGDLVLVKGSASVGMRIVVDALLSRPPTDGPSGT